MANPIPSTIAILCLAAGSLCAQGKVSFYLPNLNPVPLVSNNLTRAYLDSSYRAQLFYGATADSSTFTPVWGDLYGNASFPTPLARLPV